MEGLSEDLILSGEDFDSLFEPDTQEQETKPEEKEKKETTEDINPEGLFGSEGVGSEENNQEKEDEDTNSEKDGSSPKTNFYSSIASALKDEGILPDLDDNNIETPEDFAEAIEKHIQSKFDERQKRIDDALNAGVNSDEIRQYEGTLQFLDSV